MSLIAAQGGLSQLLVVAAMAIMVAVLLLRSHRFGPRRGQARSAIARTRRPQPEHTEASAHPPAELVRWEVEMHELARGLSGQLDSKMSALECLIQEADRAAARLEKALGGEGDGVGRKTHSPSAGGAEPLPADQAEKLKTAGSTERRPDVPRDPQAESGRRHEQIYVLSDYGLEPAEIAQRVGSPVGEVELILGLRETR